MSPREREAARLRTAALARRHRDALHRRARRIRRSVAGLAMTLFMCAFLVVYVQLASGHDPALVAAARRGSEESSTGAQATSTSGTSSTDNGPAMSSESSSEEAANGSSASSGGGQSSASALTTSQS